MPSMMTRVIGIALGCCVVLASACTTTPTGTTKDIFDFTSSTTGKSWYNEYQTLLVLRILNPRINTVILTS